MSITFRCEKCRKTVKAPDSAAGKRGKCPHCEHSNYIPLPPTDAEEIPLSPLNETQEQQQHKEFGSLIERELLREASGDSGAPLDQKENLTSEDLHHFVVNYCMDMYKANLEQAETHAQKIKKFKFTAIQAVEDFETGKVTESILKVIPKKVFKGFLKELKEKIH